MAVISERGLGVGGENLFRQESWCGKFSPVSCRGQLLLRLSHFLLWGQNKPARSRSISGARPIFVNAKNISKATLHDICIGHYTHILVSPELLTGKKFRHLLQDPHFRSMVKWVVVDELHLVSIWGDSFRKSYAMLEVIRHTLGHKPWFGCTTTYQTLADSGPIR